MTSCQHVLTGDADPGALKIDNPPAPILMVGLQGGARPPPPPSSPSA
jgi:signal recognition particle GTPase